MKKKASRRRMIYNFFITNWWLSSILISMTSMWFILMQIFGKQWTLVSETGALSSLGIIITWICVITNIIISGIKTFADKKNESAKSNGHWLLQQVLSELNAAKAAKLDRYTKGVSIRNTEFDFMNIISPKDQIHELLKSIQDFISRLSDIEKSKIGISILLFNDNNYVWLDSINIENDMNINDLIRNPNTTTRYIIDGRKSYIFWPDKRDGVEANEYILGNIDSQHANIGSIYCKDISIKEDDNNVVGAVLSVTTYGKLICNPESESEKSRFVADIMPEFELRLKTEICLYRMKEMKMLNNKKNKVPHSIASESKTD